MNFVIKDDVVSLWLITGKFQTNWVDDIGEAIESSINNIYYSSLGKMKNHIYHGELTHKLLVKKKI